MSALDLFQHDQADAMRIRPEEGRDLPATFGQTFETSWNEGALFSQSIARDNAGLAALDDYRNEVREKTGKDFGPDIDSSVAAGDQWRQANALVAKIKADNPSADISPVSDDEVEQRTVAKSQAARAAAAAMGQREKTVGGTLGGVAGSVASAAADPVNILALPVAPEAGIGYLATALRWGAIAGISQAGIEAAGGSFREEVQPGYAESGAPALNVLEAAAGGAVLGAGMKGLGQAWTAVKGRVWSQSIRDAGNVIESEANAASGNPMPGVEGEVAHRQALTKAIDDIDKGRPIDVTAHIPPQIWEQSQRLMATIEGQHAMALPLIDHAELARLGEEAGLHTRDKALLAELANIEPGDPAAADTIARLSAVQDQIGSADFSERKALLRRRDELLASTNPETLAAAAAPLEQRRVAEAERTSIADRLQAIADERGAAQAQAALLPPMIGQRRAVSLMDLRAHAINVPEQGQAATDALASGITDIASRSGYAMPADEAQGLAQRVIKAPDDEARATLADVLDRPRTAADFPTGKGDQIGEPVLPPISADAGRQMLASADHEAAVRADIDRARATGDVKIPAGVDENGEPLFRSVDAAMEEVDAYKAAADHIQACASPQEEAAE